LFLFLIIPTTSVVKVHKEFIDKILSFISKHIRRDRDFEEFEGRMRFGVTLQKSILGGGAMSYLARRYQEIEWMVEVSQREKHRFSVDRWIQWISGEVKAKYLLTLASSED
jgi:hypothetical protein